MFWELARRPWLWRLLPALGARGRCPPFVVAPPCWQRFSPAPTDSELCVPDSSFFLHGSVSRVTHLHKPGRARACFCGGGGNHALQTDLYLFRGPWRLGRGAFGWVPDWRKGTFLPFFFLEKSLGGYHPEGTEGTPYPALPLGLLSFSTLCSAGSPPGDPMALTPQHTCLPRGTLRKLVVRL